MKWSSFLLLGLIAITLSSCGVTKAQFLPVEKVVGVPKPFESVEFLLLKPNRAAICIGLINTDGNGFASHEEGVKEARKKAALLGADFILCEKSGTETATYVNPGYSSYQSKGSAYLSGNDRSIYGSASQTSSAYSVGPSVSTVNFPWGVFSAWVYRPSTSGIDLDENRVVIGFHLQSNAEEAGIRKGDKVIGIDGMGIEDDLMARHLMGVFPGNTMVYTILRDEKRLEFTIKALPN